MTIQIPNDLACRLSEVAAAQHKSVEQVAVEQLRFLDVRLTSPGYLLGVIRGLARPSEGAVDDLEAAIAAQILPVREDGLFD